MDVAIRTTNWLIAYDLLLAHGAHFDDAFERLFVRSIYEHGRFIQSNLEWDPQLRTNHYLADVAGLLFVAAYLPSTGETDTWLRFAIAELVNETLGQFTSDGGNFEASTSYHRLSAEIVVFATALALGLRSSAGFVGCPGFGLDCRRCARFFCPTDGVICFCTPLFWN